MGKAIERQEKLKKICSRISKISYNALKNEFETEYIYKIAVENESISSRLLKYDNPKVLNVDDKKTIQFIIEHFQNALMTFSEKDVDSLQFFTLKINTLIQGTNFSNAGIDNRINLIKNGPNNDVKGHSIDLVQLFNDFKEFDKFSEFTEKTNLDIAFIEDGTFLAHIRYLYSICKNCQEIDKYPLYYKQWNMMAEYFFGIEKNNYDSFSAHYAALSDLGEPKSINFGVYYHLLCLKLTKDREYNDLINVSENEKKQVEKLIWSDRFENVPRTHDPLEIAVKFKRYLENNNLSESTVNSYLNAISFVDKISIKIGISEMYSWQLNKAQINKDQLFTDEEFKQQNDNGNNMYSATVNHFCQFLKMDEKAIQFEIPPIKPFENFKWRWAVTTPSEGINSPDIIIGVLLILYKYNGKKHATQEFQNDLLELQNRIDTRIDLAKIDRGLNKNIIENSGQYWKALGLLDNSIGGKIILTSLGVSIAEDSNRLDNFIANLYSNFSLPNVNIESNEAIQEWGDNKIKIFPIKLIFNVLFQLKKQLKSPTDIYITPEELKQIIIPLSVYSELNPSIIVNHILGYRNKPNDYIKWPDCAPAANDFRMVKEYLLFLNSFGYLDLIELIDRSKRYYLNTKSIELFERNYEIDDAYNSLTDLQKKNLPFDIGTSERVKPLNKIYFGAPGTGKSYKIAQDLKKFNVDKYYQRRITFHPDYDNASFLGAYKPISYNGNIDYKFAPQIFTNIFVDACNDPENQYYLIIEEINRGNCAEIFGELFQLLDREPEYTTTPSDELIKYLDDKINTDTEYFKNKTILLPKNISILATMNTSDQSLFPMDSAFKRRWDWEYIPIDLEKDPDKNESAKYFIKLGKKQVKWIDFIGKVNQKISNNQNLGMDKCLGNYFVKPDSNGEITVKAFINKVVFYLWNDVFKDEPKESIFGKDFLEIEQDLTYESFFPIEKKGKAALQNIFNKLEVLDKKEDSEVEKNEQDN